MILLFCLLYLPAVLHAVCPDNWTMVDGQCLIFIGQAKSWQDAEDTCVDWFGADAHLATIGSEAQNDWIAENIVGTSWHGANMLTGAWTDAQENTLSFTNWNEGQPDVEGCGAMINVVGNNVVGTTNYAKWVSYECNSVLKFVCGLGQTIAVAAPFPCPSSECWDYIDGRCDVKESCASVMCSSSEITVSYSADMYLQVDHLNATETDDGYQVSCLLGDCGMSFGIEDDMMVFTLALGSEASETTMDLGDGIEVSIGGEQFVAVFKCLYSIDITVTSDAYNVTDTPTTIDPTTLDPSLLDAAVIGSGTLADAFTLDFTNDNEAPVTVGSMIEAVVSWTIQELEGVTFYLDQCQVQTGDVNVNIISDGCYANALYVSPGNSTSNTLPFSYVAFTSAGADGEQIQSLECNVRMCMSECTSPTSDDDCPSDGAAANYQYTVTGPTEE